MNNRSIYLSVYLLSFRSLTYLQYVWEGFSDGRQFHGLFARLMLLVADRGMAHARQIESRRTLQFALVERRNRCCQLHLRRTQTHKQRKKPLLLNLIHIYLLYIRFDSIRLFSDDRQQYNVIILFEIKFVSLFSSFFIYSCCSFFLLFLFVSFNLLNNNK